MTMRDGFRWRLKSATQPSHDRLDALVSQLDLTSQSGFAHFCRMHLIGFRAIAHGNPNAALDQMTGALQHDLIIVGSPEPQTSLTMGPVDALAGDYILSGSRMGTAVLRKVWQTSYDPVVKSANAYFTLQPTGKIWGDVCIALEAAPSRSHDKIIADCGRLYDLFAEAYLAARPC